MSSTSGYVDGGAYFLPDGTEVLFYVDHRDGVERISFPRSRPRRLPEDLDGRVMRPRMVECSKGHPDYHLRVEVFPVTFPCPVCAESHDIAEWMEANNYGLSHTGGGCTAWDWVYDDDDGRNWQILVADEASAPRSSGELDWPMVIINEFDADGEFISDEAGAWVEDYTKSREDSMAALDALDAPEEVKQWAREAADYLRQFPHPGRVAYEEEKRRKADPEYCPNTEDHEHRSTWSDDGLEQVCDYCSHTRRSTDEEIRAWVDLQRDAAREEALDDARQAVADGRRIPTR